MTSAHPTTKAKHEAIRSIQEMGYRVVILQSGGVEVWVRSSPERVFRFSGLVQALSALRAAEGV